ncbi:MAG: alpha/beta hydrolase [Omnitrophica bacterium]|nr:alpha/beta hydrolase [Candidatus Omnitrophota bacterium]
MKIFLWLVVFVIGFIIYAKYVERHSLYFPTRDLFAHPGSIGLSYEEVYFETEDKKRLHGWFIPASSKEAGFTILFCHGNAGNISDRMEKITLFHNWGFATFIFDYRGYGKSEGLPHESGLYRDINAAYGYLTEKRNVAEGSIVLYGESLGGAVAIDLAQRKSVGVLVTEGTFTSLRDMAKIVYPFLPRFMVSNKFDSLSKIGSIECPKVFIHSVDDEIIPFYLGEKLFNKAKPQKKLLRIKGGHNEGFFESVEEIQKAVAAFLPKQE